MTPSRVTSASRKSGTSKFTVEEIGDKEYNAAIIYNKKKVSDDLYDLYVNIPKQKENKTPSAIRR